MSDCEPQDLLDALTSRLFKGGNLVVGRESVQRSDQRGLASGERSQGQGASGSEAFKLQDLFRLFPEMLKVKSLNQIVIGFRKY